MKRRWLIGAILVAIILIVIASCKLTDSRASGQDLSGRMLLWHSLNPSETEALNQVIQSYTALYPDVNVKVQVFSTTVELNQQFINSAAAGLGPDVVLAPASYMQPLANVRAISPIDANLDDTVTARFNPAILDTLKIDDQIYGLPQTLDTLGLYVNRQLVETPATDLSTLLDQANSGTTVLVPINFTDAFWGIRAFGGQLFDEEGLTILDRGGFANWLAWLRDARNAPGMIQDTNRDVLRQRFLTGGAGYYIGYASELTEISNALEPGAVDVLPLPNGPVGQAGPLVTSQAFLFSSVSSENQRRLAVELVKFITNSEQSSRLMRLVRQVPANINVRINPRLNPIVATFVSQARNGIAKPMRAEFDAVVRLGNEAYVRTLEGGESPAEVAFAVNNSINVANGFETQNEPQYACSNLGTVQLIHDWNQPDEVNALDEVIDHFHSICPLIIVETQSATSGQLPQALTATTGARNRATVGLVDQTQLIELLASEPSLKNLNNVISSETLQRFAPIAIEAMRSQGNLYGLPLALQTDALYYNDAMVQTPAQTLDDLRAQAASGTPITLDTRFEKAFWGMRAFGTQIFAESGASLLADGGMAEWLRWLRESRDTFGIQLSANGDELLRRFLIGESAYYVGGISELSALSNALGEDLQVTLLPSGPGGPAQPLVYVEGMVVRTDISEADQSLALDFMRYVTDMESQTKLMNSDQRIPTNGNVSAAGDSFAITFFEQAQAGFLLPASPNWLPLVELGDAAYEDVVQNGLDPSEVAADLAEAINRANGIVVTPTPTAEPTVAPEEDPSAAATPAPGEEDENGEGDAATSSDGA